MAQGGGFLYFTYTTETETETRNPASELLSNLRSLLKSLVTARNPLSISKPFIMNTIMKFTEYGNR